MESGKGKVKEKKERGRKGREVGIEEWMERERERGRDGGTSVQASLPVVFSSHAVWEEARSLNHTITLSNQPAMAYPSISEDVHPASLNTYRLTTKGRVHGSTDHQLIKAEKRVLKWIIKIQLTVNA